MILSLSIIDLILFLGATQGIFLSAILITKKNTNWKANIILSCIVLLFSISIIIHLLSHLTKIFYFPGHPLFIQTLFFLIGPFIYYYTALLTNLNKFYFKPFLIHTIPFFLVLSGTIPFYFFSDSTTIYPVVYAIVYTLLFIHICIYYIVSLGLLNEYSNIIKNSFSTIEKKNLRWITLLYIFLSMIWICSLPLRLIFSIYRRGHYIWLITSIVIYIIGYMNIYQPELFGRSVIEKIKKKKYAKSLLTKQEIEKIAEHVSDYMKKEKPYLNPNLTLFFLSKKIAVSYHHLSQVINQVFCMNFYKYINKARIQEAMKLIENPRNSNIKLISIGYDSGFNSISAFYNAFKKYTKNPVFRFLFKIIGFFIFPIKQICKRNSHKLGSILKKNPLCSTKTK